MVCVRGLLRLPTNCQRWRAHCWCAWCHALPLLEPAEARARSAVFRNHALLCLRRGAVAPRCFACLVAVCLAVVCVCMCVSHADGCSFWGCQRHYHYCASWATALAPVLQGEHAGSVPHRPHCRNEPAARNRPNTCSSGGSDRHTAAREHAPCSSVAVQPQGKQTAAVAATAPLSHSPRRSAPCFVR
jgi:hypothetical protein